MTDVSKLCSDFLRKTYPGLKASHARELVAAFFGYKKHASLLAETAYHVDKIDEADLLIPDIAMIEKRRARLDNLAQGLGESKELAEKLAEFLEEQKMFFGETWILEDDLATYMLDDYLPNNVDGRLDDYLSGEIAETNAYFDEPYYDQATVEDGVDSVKVVVTGTYNGEHNIENDSMYAGDTIDMTISVELMRVAGRVAFMEPEVEVSGSVNRDYHDDYDGDDNDDEDESAA